MKRFVISEDERSRILSMHESATKRQYLSEQPAPQQGTKVADPNSEMYTIPAYKFLLDTNLPEFLAKNKINFKELMQSGAKFDGDKNNIMWKPQGYTLYLPILTGGEKYLDSYSGNEAKYTEAYNKVKNEYYTKKDKSGKAIEYYVKAYGCLQDGKQFYPFKPSSTMNINAHTYCKAAAEMLDKLAKDTKLKEYSRLSGIEKFINLAPKFTA
jgi:hypothetical protein